MQQAAWRHFPNHADGRFGLSHHQGVFFYASMTSDEGRWPQVSLHSRGRENASQRIASFEPPIVATATTIAKLAHTVTDLCSLEFADVEEEPVIVGILPSLSALLGTFITQRAKTFSSFKVAIRGPGNIDVICEKVVLTYYYSAELVFFLAAVGGRITEG
jgi:hypothetical protein